MTSPEYKASLFYQAFTLLAVLGLVAAQTERAQAAPLNPSPQDNKTNNLYDPSFSPATLHASLTDNPQSLYQPEIARWLGLIPPASEKPQRVISVNCPPLPVAGGYETTYQPPIVTCEVEQSEGQNVLQFNILPPNKEGVYMINPAPGYLVITSNISGFFPFLAFYTNYKQHTLSESQIGDYLFEQDQPVTMQIGGKDVSVKAKGMDVIVRYEGDNIIFDDGTSISYLTFIEQMFFSSGLNPDDYDLGATIHAPMVEVSTEITDMFPIHSDATETPAPSLWEATATPTTTFENPIQATASIGLITILDENGDPAGFRTATEIITPPLEAPVSQVTDINFNFNVLTNPNQKFVATHCNTDTRNPIPLSPDVATSLANAQAINNPIELFNLADAIVAESGSAWNEWFADLWADGAYKGHHIFSTEKVKASELGMISIKAARIDEQQIVHIVGHDQNACLISFDMKASTLRKLFKTEGFVSASSANGENAAAVEILRTMLTQTTQVNKIAYTIPPQYVDATLDGDTWAEAWQAIQVVGTIPAYLTGPDLVVNPNFSLVNIPVGAQVKPVGFYTDIFGVKYAIVTPDDFDLTPALIGAQQALNLDPYSSDIYLIIPLNSLISSTKQP